MRKFNLPFSRMHRDAMIDYLYEEHNINTAAEVVIKTHGSESHGQGK